MYSIGVFTGFTMAGAGMVKHHLTHRDAHWRKSRVAINGVAAVVCAVVVIVFAVAEFTHGAWVVVMVMPLLVYALDAHQPPVPGRGRRPRGRAPPSRPARPSILRRHVVVILIDRIDLAAARAIQYARTLMPDDLRAVHFNIDNQRAESSDRALAAGRAARNCPSTSSTAPTAGWAGPRSSWPPSWPTARPR